MQRYLIWDFDGTLGYREGGWSGALVEVLERSEPACSILREQIIPHLQSGFPWHDPDVHCLPARSAEAWWQALEPVFSRAFAAVGMPNHRAIELAACVRDAYASPDNWRLYDDSLPTLEELSRDGWTHVILSNHVPELSLILEDLGVLRFVDRVFNSAETGFEKPHPRAFANVISHIEDGAPVWMIGDNPRADIAGAAAAGIPGIRVRQPPPHSKNQCEHLQSLRTILADHSQG